MTSVNPRRLESPPVEDGDGAIDRFVADGTAMRRMRDKYADSKGIVSVAWSIRIFSRSFR